MAIWILLFPSYRSTPRPSVLGIRKDKDESVGVFISNFPRLLRCFMKRKSLIYTAFL